MATTPATDVGSAISQLETRMTKVELRRRGFATSVVTSAPTYAQDTAPTPPIATGAIWYDTSNNNTAYRWDGTQWMAVIDPSVDLARDAAAIDLVNAQDQDGSPDGKITTKLQSNAPAVGPVGDLWVDTDNNHLYRSNGVSWVDTGDTATGASIRRPENASTIADGQIQTWWQNNPPTPDGFGDLWVDTSSDPMSLYRWNNYDWVRISDWSLAQISDKIDTKITTFRQPNIPTSTAMGDIWFDTDDGNKQYRAAAKGVNTIGTGAWVLVRDDGIDEAQETADSKIRSYYQMSVPTAVSVGDVWFDTDNGNKQYRAMNVGATTVQTPGSPTGWVVVQDEQIIDEVEALKTDGLPPSTSPTPSVTDGINAIYLRWSPPVNNDPMSYDIHMSSESGFTPNSFNLIANTSSTIQTVKSGPVNLVSNPSGRADTSGWLRANCELSISTDQGYAGDSSFKLTAYGASAPYIYTPQGLAGIPVVPGRTYRAVTRLRTGPGLSHNGSINVTWYNSSGTTSGLPATFGPSTAVTDAGWTTVGMNVVPAAGAVFASVTVGFSGSGYTAGEEYFVDGVELLDTSIDGPLMTELPYFFRLVARDADGPSPAPSPAVTGKIKLADNEEISTNYLYAGDVSATQITTGTLAAEVILSGSFKTANAGRRVEIDPLGVRLYGQDESVLVTLPTSLNEDPKFTGSLQAVDLIVQDALSLYGQNNYFATGSQVKLQTSTSAPSTALTLTSDWETYAGGGGTTHPQINGPYNTPRGAWVSADDVSDGKAVGEFFGAGNLYVGHGTFYTWPKITQSDGSVVSTIIGSGLTEVWVNGKSLTLIAAIYRQAGQPESASQAQIILLDTSVMTAPGIPPQQLAQMNVTKSWYYGQRVMGPFIFNNIANRNRACAIRSRGNGAWTFEQYTVNYSGGVYSITQDSTWDMPQPNNSFAAMPSGVVYIDGAVAGFPSYGGHGAVVAESLDGDGSISSVHVYDTSTGLETTQHNFTSNKPAFAFFAAHDPQTNTFGGFRSIDNGGAQSVVTKYSDVTWTSESPVWWGAYTWADTNTTGLQQLKTGGATSGTFTLSYGAQTTPAIAYNASPTAVALALNGLSSLNGHVSVTMFAGETVGLPGNRLAIQIDSASGIPPSMLTFNGTSLVGATGAGVTTPVESTTHETDMSKVSNSIVMKKRQRLNVTLPGFPAPQAGVGKPRAYDDVNAAVVYLARSATAPTRTTLWKQAVQPAPMVNFIQYSTPPAFTGSGSDHPPSLNNFPSSAAALLESSSNNSYGSNKLTINGDGFAHLETLDMHTPNNVNVALTGSVFEQLRYVNRAQSAMVMDTPATRGVSPGVISWNSRIMMIALGNQSYLANNGYFEIVTPPVGTVIPAIGSISTSTVTSAGLVPLPPYTALYYIPPWGSTNASVPANFRLVEYSATFSVPHDWVMVAIRSDTNNVRWFDGQTDSGWTLPTLQNGWTQYATGWEVMYRKLNGVVYLRGLISKPSAPYNTTMFTLPAGFRPILANIFGQETANAAGGVAAAPATVYVQTNGDVAPSAGASGVWNTLSGIQFPADN